MDNYPPGFDPKVLDGDTSIYDYDAGWHICNDGSEHYDPECTLYTESDKEEE